MPGNTGWIALWETTDMPSLFRLASSSIRRALVRDFASGEARTKPLDPLANPPLRCWSGLTALDRDAILPSDGVRRRENARCSHIAHSPRSPSALPSPAVPSLLIPVRGLKQLECSASPEHTLKSQACLSRL